MLIQATIRITLFKYNQFNRKWTTDPRQCYHSVIKYDNLKAEGIRPRDNELFDVVAKTGKVAWSSVDAGPGVDRIVVDSR